MWYNSADYTELLPQKDSDPPPSAFAIIKASAFYWMVESSWVSCKNGLTLRDKTSREFSTWQQIAKNISLKHF